MNVLLIPRPARVYIFRTGRTIPITSQKESPDIYQAAFQKIFEELEKGQLVCIFPEGKLTKNGKIDAFKKGIEKIVRDKLEILLLETKRYEVFEQLKEKDFQKWSHMQHQIEQKEIGENTLLRYGREFI